MWKWEGGGVKEKEEKGENIGKRKQRDCIKSVLSNPTLLIYMICTIYYYFLFFFGNASDSQTAHELIHAS